MNDCWCDEQGPQMPGLWGASIELHRALHDLVRLAVEPLIPLVEWADNKLTKGDPK